MQLLDADSTSTTSVKLEEERKKERILGACVSRKRVGGVIWEQLHPGGLAVVDSVSSRTLCKAQLGLWETNMPLYGLGSGEN